jgi:hypothetical protein
MTKIAPLLPGVHLIPGPNGWSFTGEIPVGIKIGGYSTEHEGICAFVNWFKSQDSDFQREHVDNLRNDVFALLINF